MPPLIRDCQIYHIIDLLVTHRWWYILFYGADGSRLGHGGTLFPYRTYRVRGGVLPYLPYVLSSLCTSSSTLRELWCWREKDARSTVMRYSACGGLSFSAPSPTDILLYGVRSRILPPYRHYCCGQLPLLYGAA